MALQHNPLYKLLGIDTIVSAFNSNVKFMNWAKANLQFMQDLNIGIETRLKRIPKKGPVLFYANHPTGIDPYIISAFLGRDDLYFIADNYQQKKGIYISQHIIPVYYDSWLDFAKRPFISWWGFLLMRILTGSVSSKFAKEKNIAAVNDAVNHLQKGHAVLIFPTGAERESNAWKKGIGYILLNSYKKKIMPELFALHISKLHELILFWHFISGRKYLIKHPVEIQGVKLPFPVHLNDPKKLTDFLQKKYNENFIP